MWLLNKTNISLCLWPIHISIRPLRMLKHFWQRLTRGFDDSVLWGLDYHLAAIILPRLKAFHAAEKHGCPIAFLEDKIVHTEEEIQDGIKKFKAEIAKMIYAFECILDEEKDLCDVIEDKYIDAYKKREKKIEEGLKLFGEHFQRLWG